MGLKWSLRLKLISLSIGMSAVALCVAVFSYAGQATTQEKYEIVARGVLDDVVTIDEIYLSFKETRIALRTLGLAYVGDSQRQMAKEEALSSVKRVDELLKKFDRENLIEGELELVQKVVEDWQTFKAIGNRIFTLEEQNTEASRQELAKIFFEDCPQAAKKFMKSARGLQEFLSQKQGAWVAEARSTAALNDKVLLLFSTLGISTGLVFSILFSGRVSAKLLTINKELTEGSTELTKASVEIAATGVALAEASNKQAASLEETVATIEELTSMVNLNTANAKTAAELAASTRDTAIQGEREIKELISSIHRISDDSKKIAEITSVIDDIAFQTNLLALNAAVEAARAGEQGKGFAVVAEAVRNLAQRSAESAKSIAVLIDNSVERIEQGAQQANRGGVVLGEVVTAVKKVSDINNEIATASAEQSHGIVQIGQAMNQLDQVTQQNASASEEAASSSEKLSLESQRLLHNVTMLAKLITGEESERQN